MSNQPHHQAEATSSTGETGEGRQSGAPKKHEKKPRLRSLRSLACVSLTTVLPPTPYRDADDRGTLNRDLTINPVSDRYVHVQVRILQYLQHSAAEDLSQAQAHSWTERISPDGCPTVAEAVRLCYYMRELGFDTYSKLMVELDELRLYIANKHVLFRDPERPNIDRIYWRQNLKTGSIAVIDTSPEPTMRPRTRRGAIGGGTLDLPQPPLFQTPFHPTDPFSLSDDHPLYSPDPYTLHFGSSDDGAPPFLTREEIDILGIGGGQRDDGRN
ncbi:hypothetical protein BU24DRAFT_416311 [Aaosphaeria arxii CBS 175.79]|uniref:Uncharacterized protein n=1 Tax=Aaosphaeria arxii CBS 175.79 TaxID=1450172 RepID=A0A6A5Y4X7_9PLEO|nr:uncharacterized protein BU24DRAFT_416311 [Aaosphaeria arxii CBS 175.79]KAF2020635.1 hypothetical protein BU24DRAFT_416311 [Aaosphaeria arxii CBS 175.79]